MIPSTSSAFNYQSSSNASSSMSASNPVGPQLSVSPFPIMYQPQQPMHIPNQYTAQPQPLPVSSPIPLFSLQPHIQCLNNRPTLVIPYPFYVPVVSVQPQPTNQIASITPTPTPTPLEIESNEKNNKIEMSHTRLGTAAPSPELRPDTADLELDSFALPQAATKQSISRNENGATVVSISPRPMSISQ